MTNHFHPINWNLTLIPASAKRQAKPERVVADYIAGMTDRFATKEHERMQGRVAFPL